MHECPFHDKFIKVGSVWYNPSDVVRIEQTGDDPPAVTLQVVAHERSASFPLTGADAECLLECLGHGKAVREKEAKAAEKAAHDAEKAAHGKK